jgi:hypothetical protein
MTPKLVLFNPSGRIVTRGTGADRYAAIDWVAERAGRAVGREFVRRSELGRRGARVRRRGRAQLIQVREGTRPISNQEDEMPFYRDRDATGRPDELIIVEDARMVFIDSNGDRRPGFRYVGHQVIRAHPLILDALLEQAEPLWGLADLLEALGAGRQPDPGQTLQR